MQREIARAYSEANNTQEAVSSNESLITVPDEDTTPASPERSPSRQAKALISSLSPNSAKSWMKSIFRKRRRESSDDDSSDEGSDVQKSKRHAAARNAEVAGTPGVVLPPGFSRYHHILFVNDVYMPLTLFTNLNLRHINRGHALTTTEISVCSTRGKIKSVKILDIAKFEALHGAEENLSYDQWFEAARNYVRFFKKTCSKTSRPSSSWISRCAKTTSLSRSPFRISTMSLSSTKCSRMSICKGWKNINVRWLKCGLALINRDGTRQKAS